METGCQNIQLCTTILKVAFPIHVIGAMFLFPLLYIIVQCTVALLLILCFRCYQILKPSAEGKCHSHLLGLRGGGLKNKLLTHFSNANSYHTNRQYVTLFSHRKDCVPVCWWETRGSDTALVSEKQLRGQKTKHHWRSQHHRPQPSAAERSEGETESWMLRTEPIKTLPVSHSQNTICMFLSLLIQNFKCRPTNFLSRN